MSAPVLGPSERAAWEAIKQWAASAFCLDSETPEDAARNVTAAINALLAAEPEAAPREWKVDRTQLNQPVPLDPETGELVQPPAAPAPDAELERLLKRLRLDTVDKQCAETEKERQEAERVQNDTMQAIHAHVETLCQRREAAARGESADDGVALIAAARRRHKAVEGWTPEHDDQHTNGELAQAAIAYAAHDLPDHVEVGSAWPFEWDWWKPKDAINNLARAGSLIAAEIDRLKRAHPEG